MNVITTHNIFWRPVFYIFTEREQNRHVNENKTKNLKPIVSGIENRKSAIELK